MSLSDRELDAKVAERVTCLPSVQKVMTAAGDMDWMYSAETPPRAVGEGGYLKFVPWYSTTGDGMLAVVEAMRGKGYFVTIHAWTLKGKERWRAYFDPGDGANDNSIPRAVCLAALRALGGAE